MKPKKINMYKSILLATLVGITLAGCQALIPNAKGLPALSSLAQAQNTQPQNTQSEQQAEVIWKDKSFGFLLYQEKVGDKLHVLALSLSGQVLFELEYNGKKIKVLERIDALKALPLDFLMRDIWWASMPASDVNAAITPLHLTLHDDAHSRLIMDDKQAIKLKVQKQAGQAIIDNTSANYRLILTQTEHGFLSSQDDTTPLVTP